MLERLPNEILFEILEYVPDFVSLRNVVLACPVFYRLYPGRFITLFTSILDQIHSRQLRGLVKTVLAVRHNTTTKCSLNARFTYKDFIFTIPDVKGDPLRLEDVVHPLSALCHIAAAYQDLKYFEKSFVASCFSRWGLDQTEERAMSPAEIHRIQRALWTVQLLLETSNAEPPLNSVSILERAGTIDNFPSRHNGSPSSSNENGRLVYGLDLPTETEFCRQRDGIRDYFIYRLTPWELEEVEYCPGQPSRDSKQAPATFQARTDLTLEDGNLSEFTTGMGIIQTIGCQAIASGWNLEFSMTGDIASGTTKGCVIGIGSTPIMTGSLIG
ncbi:MAG: hypothetical protein LQ346_002054 [Caloplaca aetnensis]|nr:MAG: hypothetical protein LQ346_002054 [Caloplaca aetnensis]